MGFKDPRHLESIRLSVNVGEMLSRYLYEIQLDL